MSIVTVKDLITLRAPSFVTDPKIDDYIALSEMLTSAVFEAQRSYAVALMVMHWISQKEMGTDQGGGGLVTGESEGGLSRSYQHSGASSSDDSLGSTSFGKELLQLRRSCIFSPTIRSD